MTRVLHLNTERTWRGGERQTLWLARELQRRGHAGWVACRPGFPLDKVCREAGLETVPAAPWFEADPFAARRLRRFCADSGVELLHAHTGHAVALAALAAAGTGLKVVATRRVDFPIGRGPLTRWKYDRVHALAVLSGRVREVVLEGGMSPEKIRVIPSGIDPSGYPSRADRDALRRERGFAPEDVLVVNAAALAPHKDHETLLRAVRRVAAALARARFLILGEGPLRGALEDLARSLGVAHRVHFLGHRADVLQYIAMSDLFVFSSKEEGLGTSLLDAMALGVPTAAARAGGIPDVYGGPDAPELCAPQDPAALAENMLRVLTDADEARRRRERGAARAALFTVPVMAERYEELYRHVLGRAA